MTNSIELFDRAFAAYDDGDVDALSDLVVAIRSGGVEPGDARLRFFELMHAELEDPDSDERIDDDDILSEGLSVLARAVEIAEPRHAVFVALEVAGLLVGAEEVDDVEHALRTLVARRDLDEESAGDARLAWAALTFDEQDDPEEALEILDGASDWLRGRSSYASLRAAVYLELDRADEAVALLESALDALTTSEAQDAEEETELRYQLGVVLRDLGRPEPALEQLLEVRRRDLAAHGIDPDIKIDSEEAGDLRRHLEELLDTLPEPVVKRVATAAIRVERWPSEAAVQVGSDPRRALAFEGELAEDDDEGRVDALVIYRDVLLTLIFDDDEITDCLAVGLAEEFDRFFDLDLIPGM